MSRFDGRVNIAATIALTVVAGVISMISALAQGEDPMMGKGPVGLVSPVAGWPFSAQQVELRNRVLPDGVSSTKEMTSQIYRDNRGRVRIEWRIEGSSGIAYIIDPVASSMVILLEDAKVADRMAVPKSDSGEFRGGLPAIGEPLPLGKWQAKTETLGERVIYGVKVDGRRTVQTLALDDNPPLMATQEVWLSRSLGVMMAAEASGPNWSDTARLTNLERQEPDPALFIIPADYKIQDQ
jgi:hypothetical protein